MENIFNWIKLALPFLQLAYDGALLVSPAVAAELKVAIDALQRAADVPPSSSMVARGYDAIDVFGKNVITALGTLKTSDVSADEKTRQAGELVASLSDPTKVYQAKHGKDADLLASYKTKAQGLADAINQ